MTTVTPTMEVIVSRFKKTTGPFGKLRSMPSFEEAKDRLLAGVTPTRVAKWMHEQGDYTDIPPTSLAATLCAYRRTLSSAELVQTREPSFVANAKDEIEEGLDELAELAEVFGIQKDRILQGRKLESKLGVLNKTLGNEVRIAGELLRTSMTIKQSLGLASDTPAEAGQHPGPQFRYDVRSRYGERIAQVVEDPGKRNRVLNVVQALVDAAEAEQQLKKTG